MSILKRMGSIFKSNVNSALDKMEDPSKMVDQTMRELKEELNKNASLTASVMAEKNKAQREVDSLNDEIKKLTDYAKKALASGNETDAKKLLEKKRQIAERLTIAEKQLALAEANAKKVKDAHANLTKKIVELDAKKSQIKSTMQMAKTQEKINDLNLDALGAGGTSKMKELEDKANAALDTAMAMEELNSTPSDGIDDLMSKYDTVVTPSVDSELEELKAQLNN